MRKPALYSSSRPEQAARAPNPAEQPDVASAAPPSRRRFVPTNNQLLWATILVLAALLAYSLVLRPVQRKLTQDDINAAVLKTLETQTLPSEYAKAYDNIRPSVVRVISYVNKSRLKDDKTAQLPKGGARPKPLGPARAASAPGGDDEEIEHGVGTGVVIVDKGVILTNLHVVSGADRI
ncbi:MAG: peptidase S1, partial [Ramlibacter sp.]